MSNASYDGQWQSYALTGRPDFLNYLRRGDVTWSQLWEFYRDNPAEADTMIRLIRLFHAFLSQVYDAEGAVLDRDGEVYPRLREWAEYAVAAQEFLPEEKVTQAMGDLLDQSLISRLYFEAVYSVYVEAALARSVSAWQADSGEVDVPRDAAATREAAGDDARKAAARLTLNLDYPDPPVDRIAVDVWHSTVSAVIARHERRWLAAFSAVCRDDEAEWYDEGVSG